MTSITNINDLVSYVIDRVDPAGLIARSDIEQIVRGERTERYEDHDSNALGSLCERVYARIVEACEVSR